MKQVSRRARAGAGFTLIELLVVIAIIAILAAILFPVFASAREKARQTTCASNEKQLGLAFLQYCQDYDEYYPSGVTGNPFGNAGNGFHNGIGWAGQIYNYVKATGAFACPDDTTNPGTGSVQDARAGGNSAGSPGTTPIFPVSYCYNRNLTKAAGSPYTAVAVTAAQLLSPTVTVLLFESEGSKADITDANLASLGYVDGSSPSSNGTCNGYGGCPATGIQVMSVSGGVMATGLFAGTVAASNSAFLNNGMAIHTDGANYAFTDGHVKWLKPGLISAGTTNGNSTPDCGVYPGGNYTSGNGQRAVSASMVGQCTGGGPAATFSEK